MSDTFTFTEDQQHCYDFEMKTVGLSFGKSINRMKAYEGFGDDYEYPVAEKSVDFTKPKKQKSRLVFK